MLLGKTNIIQPKMKEYNFLYDFTGSVQEFTAPQTGRYKIECLGAGSAAKGSYASATIFLIKGDKLYVYVGGQNNTFNGGGSAASASGSNSTWSKATNGCGASDVRTIKHTSDTWQGEDSLLSRIVTAGGSGGSGTYRSYGEDYRHWTDENGYNRCTTSYKESAGSFSSKSEEESNDVLGLGSTASVKAGTKQHWEHTHGSDYPYSDGQKIYGDWYASSGSASGGGGFYGGTNGKTGTSAIIDTAKMPSGRSLKVKDALIDKCAHTGNGYVRITNAG